MKIDMDAKDLGHLLRYYYKAPKKFKAASAMWVNRAAFGTRKNVLDYMHSKMTIRNPAFLRSRMRVQKARSSVPYSQQMAFMGSVRTARHTGWAEQEGLKQDERKKTVTLAARLDSKVKRIPPRMRMKKGLSWRRPEDYAGRTRRQRANAMLQIIGAGRDRKPFILHGHRTLPAGLWRFGGGPKGRREIVPIQIFDRRPARPKRSPWLRNSTKKYFAGLNRRAVWSDIVRRIRANKR